MFFWNRMYAFFCIFISYDIIIENVIIFANNELKFIFICCYLEKPITLTEYTINNMTYLTSRCYIFTNCPNESCLKPWPKHTMQLSLCNEFHQELSPFTNNLKKDPRYLGRTLPPSFHCKAKQDLSSCHCLP